MKNFSKRRDHIVFNSDENALNKGELFSINTTDESFLRINRGYTYDDLITVVHEYMHATSFSINEDHFLRNKELYIEIDPIFTEIIALDYFEKLFNDHKMDALKLYLHREFCSFATTNSKFINLHASEKDKNDIKTNKELRKRAKDYGIIELEKEIEDINSKPLLDYIFAIEFYNLYKEDKEKALENLKKFVLLSCNNEVEYYDNIKRLGIYPNEHAKEFHQERLELVRKLKRNN